MAFPTGVASNKLAHTLRWVEVGMLSMSSVAVATFISCVREFGWKSFRVDVGGDDPLETGTR